MKLKMTLDRIRKPEFNFMRMHFGISYHDLFGDAAIFIEKRDATVINASETTVFYYSKTKFIRV